jgi:hypothetical protein
MGGKNMEGIFFYWFAWIGWTVSTFLMSKQSMRSFYACALLACIMFSTTSLHIGPYTFSGAFFCFLLFGSVYIALRKQMFSGYLLLASFITMMAYAGFCLFELFDPVWIFIDRRWAIGFLMLYIVCMLVKSVQERIVCLIIGICYGDFVFSYILHDSHMYYTIGSLVFLDIAAISCMLILVWTLFVQVALYFDSYLLKYAKNKGSKMRV